MKTIEIKKENVDQALKMATGDTKKVLQVLLGQKSDGPVTDRIKSFGDACIELYLDPDAELPYDVPANDRQLAVQSFTMMIIIAEALNEGWVPDYSNGNQEKWYPWFEWKQSKAGFGFTRTGTGWASTSTAVGARLVFKTQELAAYAGKQFEDIYNGFITLKAQ
jgi:hypothetical protein